MIYCPHCFFENPDTAQQCEKCGGALYIQNRKNHLPVMNILAGRYLVGKTLGEGGFGITYAGFDLRLKKRVAIKEFFPNGLAMRMDTRSCTVEASSDSGIPALQQGREKFLGEAQTMSRFNELPTVVDVRDFFKENGTAYIVMEYLDGISMGQYLRQHGPEREFDRLYAMLRPVMEDLGKIHQEGLIHRDISPSNLMLLKNGSVKLLDFGTAREMSEEGEKSLSVVLKPGFAPEEQYRRRGQQGAWTDVYAFCATMYKLLTGLTPEVAMDRLAEDTLQPPSQLGVRISRRQEQTLLRGLAVRSSERIRSMEELIAGFEGKVTAAPTVSAPASAPALRRDTPSTEKKKPKQGLVLGLCALAVVAVAVVFFALPRIVPAMKYRHAVALMEAENYTEAIAAFEALDGYKDSAEQITLCETEILYAEAVALMESGKTVEAYEALVSLDGYRDSSERAASIFEQYKLKTADVGDHVTFGSYEQDNDTTNGTEPVQWRVLAKEENRVLVISEYALETRQYNEKYTSVTWENCILRSWLNEEFYNTAFTAAEQAMIPTTTVKAQKNPRYSTDPGEDTQDKVFLLSIQEVEQYFSSNETRRCAPTAYAKYAKAQGAYASTGYGYKTESGEATCRWWLRSPGYYQYFAAIVSNDGGVYETGNGVGINYYCVRPALWIDLEASPSTPEPTPEPTPKPTPEPIPTPVPIIATNVGELVTFGSYEQDNDTTNGTEPIQWRVLAKEENRVLVISEYALEARPYNEESARVTWETCTLRGWLNEEFYNTAFTSTEQTMIPTTTVKAQKNPSYSTDPGKDTQDKVFLLSIQEVNEYFASDVARKCAPTAYAKAQGAYTITGNKTASGEATCWWWLRSSGCDQCRAADVYVVGGVSEGGTYVFHDYGCVRPALWIDLDS